jgi:hypothetical protein
MTRGIDVRFMSVLAFSSLLMAHQWWEKEPYIQWSAEQVYKVLNDSPWVGLSPAGIRRLEAVQNYNLSRYSRGISLPVYYRVRLLTAKPVREALLRQLSLGIENTVSANDLSAKTGAEEERALLEKFMTHNADDLRIKGDEKHIVVGLTLFVAAQEPGTRLRGGRMTWLEEPYGDELSGADISELRASLVTGTGKRVAIVDYKPPGPDLLGAKLYFPRDLPDGSPFITAGDKELRFEAFMNNTRIKARFDLKRMKYKGKLET